MSKILVLAGGSVKGAFQAGAIKALAELVAELAGFEGEIAWDSTKPDGTPRKVLDVTKAKSLGWAPKISLRDGIASTIDWYKKAAAKGELRR